MTIWEAIILGILQGLTEFLPVSSSGHLELANNLFGIEEPSNLRFTMALHGGTVLSTIVVFWREIGKLFSGLFKFRMNTETKFVIYLLISAIPIGLVGVLFGDNIEAMFTSNIRLVGIMLIFTALLLTFANYAKPRQRPVNGWNALLIGISQAIAVIPGLSRSGTTISAGLLLGVKREEVSKFSFLMVLIPIIGMNFLELFKGYETAVSVDTVQVIAGFITAFIVGTLACKMMIRIVNRGKLIWFALYCLLVGSASVIMSYVN